MKKKNFRPQSTSREKPPKFRTVDGNVQILCPFCEPAHPIYPDKISMCGTVLKVSALQTVYPARTLKKTEIVCVKCGKPGGEMVAYGNGFVHIQDCNPERKLLSSPPIYSDWAYRVYHLPVWLRSWIEKFSGAALEVVELDGFGKETGKIMGYYFAEVPNGKRIDKREHPPASA